MNRSRSRAGLRASGWKPPITLALTFTNSVQSLPLDFVLIHKGHSLSDFAILTRKAKRSSKNLGERAGVCGHYATMHPETRRKESLLSGHPGAQDNRSLRTGCPLYKGAGHLGARPPPSNWRRGFSESTGRPPACLVAGSAWTPMGPGSFAPTAREGGIRVSSFSRRGCERQSPTSLNRNNVYSMLE